jgi:two-component system, LytTR family, sensor kinase
MRLIAIWLGVALFISAQNIVVSLSRGGSINWQWDVMHELVYWLTWAAFTPLVLRCAERWRPDPARGGLARVVPSLTGVGLLIAPLQITTAYSTHDLLLVLSGHLPLAEASAWFAQRKSGLVWGTFTGVVYYWAIVLAWWAVLFQQMYRAQRVAAAELEASLTAARLDALRAQLQPHFLFNTLNAISVLAGEDATKAKRMVVRLADLLRLTLAEGGRQEVRLAEELELLERYLDIQRARFEDRLRVHFDIEPGTRNVLVPVLLLQPLVENAIRHGVDPSIDGGTIAVVARREHDQLQLEVRDNGRGLSTPGAEPRDGVGLANTRARLAHLYGDRQALSLTTPAEGGTAVVISLPFRTAT